MNKDIAERMELRMEDVYEGFGDKEKKVGEFVITFDGMEIATGMKNRKKFAYQLQMGEVERLGLRDNLQEVVHQISVLANAHYKTGWTFSRYDKTSWSKDYDYFKIPVKTDKQIFVERLQKHKEQNTKDGKI